MGNTADKNRAYADLSGEPENPLFHISEQPEILKENDTLDIKINIDEPKESVSALSARTGSLKSDSHKSVQTDSTGKSMENRLSLASLSLSPRKSKKYQKEDDSSVKSDDPDITKSQKRRKSSMFSKKGQKIEHQQTELPDINDDSFVTDTTTKKNKKSPKMSENESSSSYIHETLADPDNGNLELVGEYSSDKKSRFRIKQPKLRKYSKTEEGVVKKPSPRKSKKEKDSQLREHEISPVIPEETTSGVSPVFSSAEDSGSLEQIDDSKPKKARFALLSRKKEESPADDSNTKDGTDELKKKSFSISPHSTKSYQLGDASTGSTGGKEDDIKNYKFSIMSKIPSSSPPITPRTKANVAVQQNVNDDALHVEGESTEEKPAENPEYPDQLKKKTFSLPSPKLLKSNYQYDSGSPVESDNQPEDANVKSYKKGIQLPRFSSGPTLNEINKKKKIDKNVEFNNVDQEDDNNKKDVQKYSIMGNLTPDMKKLSLPSPLRKGSSHFRDKSKCSPPPLAELPSEIEPPHENNEIEEAMFSENDISKKKKKFENPFRSPRNQKLQQETPSIYDEEDFSKEVKRRPMLSLPSPRIRKSYHKEGDLVTGKSSTTVISAMINKEVDTSPQKESTNYMEVLGQNNPENI